jgi:aldose 1-epimerase
MTALESDEIVLAFNDYRAVVSAFGASLRRFWRESSGEITPILWGYSHRDEKKGGQGDVLMPFAGRIPGGTYSFEGNSYTLERNDKEGPNAIHGFVRTRSWSSRSSNAAASFRLRLAEAEMAARGYPFSLDLGVSYELSSQGLSCRFSIQNIGARPAPVSAGFHPYFQTSGFTINEASLRLPAREVLEFAPGFLPTGKILALDQLPELNFIRTRSIGATVLNHCFRSLERDEHGWARAELRDPASESLTTIRMSPEFDYLVVYTGEALGDDARRAIAIEPMTAGTDAFNRPQWGLKVLNPGEYFGGTWSVSNQVLTPDAELTD